MMIKIEKKVYSLSFAPLRVVCQCLARVRAPTEHQNDAVHGEVDRAMRGALRGLEPDKFVREINAAVGAVAAAVPTWGAAALLVEHKRRRDAA